MNECPRPGCTATVEWDRFACRADWFSLPRAIRAEISAAWRARLNRRPGSAERHEQAKAAALEHWSRSADPAPSS